MNSYFDKVIYNRINNIKSRWILWSICFFILSSCETTTKQEFNIIGKWNVVNADRNGSRTSTLEDAYFQFNADSTMVTNILRRDLTTGYTIRDRTIVQNTNSPLAFDIVDLIGDSLILSSKIRDYEFVFYMNRDTILSIVEDPPLEI